MGLFLAMSGVIGATDQAIQSALHRFADAHGGALRRSARSTEEPNTLVLLNDNLRCSVLYPRGFLGWDQASQDLSKSLDVPVFSFHIHDGDLWMFMLFDKGEVVGKFNPLPEYWDDNVSDEERAAWSGDAATIAACIPGLAPEAIRPYLRHWDFDDTNPGKAFPEDQFSFHDCWQLCDFMRKIGLRYPLGDTGQVLGETYEFLIPGEGFSG